MKPCVSVCIPTYNGSRYLEECMQSVLAQTFEDYEIIVSDDKSTDATVEVVEKYAKTDKRIRVFQNDRNLGLVQNSNQCAFLARGEWIKFVYQDDIIFPDCLRNMLAGNTLQMPIVSCKRNFKFEDNVDDAVRQFLLKCPTIEEIFPEKRIIQKEDICLAAVKYFGTNFIGEPTAVLLKKEVFYQYGLINSHLVQICDLEFWLRIASNTGMCFVPEQLASFRVHGESATSINTRSGNVRKSILDRLILWHEMTLNPFYCELRRTIKRLMPGVDFAGQLAWRSRDAYRKVLGRSKYCNADMNIFLEIISFFPALRYFSRRIVLNFSLLGLIRQLFGKNGPNSR